MKNLTLITFIAFTLIGCSNTHKMDIPCSDISSIELINLGQAHLEVKLKNGSTITTKGNIKNYLTLTEATKNSFGDGYIIYPMNPNSILNKDKTITLILE